MSRYEQILKKTYDSFDVSEPVHIVASALLKDTVNTRYLAQLKLRNDSELDVDQVTVTVIPLDAFGSSVGDEISYTYEKSKVEPHMEFASDEAIIFPDIEGIASFNATVKTVTFSDDLEWKVGYSMEDVRSARNESIRADIDTAVSQNDFEKAFELAERMMDSEENKDAVKDEIYKRCMDAADLQISNGTIDEAEKVLANVPEQYERKNELLNLINAAKKETFEKEQEKKKKKIRLFIILGIAVAVLIAVIVAINVHHKANTLPFKVGDSYETVQEILEQDAEDFEDYSDSCCGWYDYFGTGDIYSQYAEIYSDDYGDVSEIKVTVLASYQEEVVAKVNRVFDIDTGNINVDEDNDTITMNNEDVSIEINSGYTWKDTVDHNPGAAVIIVTINGSD